MVSRVTRRSGLALVALLASCAADPCPDGSMLDREGGLLLTEARHPTGWGQAECASCHALPQLHRQGCTPEVDMQAVRAIVDEEGLDSCASCHGDNGSGEGR